jgi:hypothetical protein
MQIKIIQAGWEGFTGDFGAVSFVDGVSVSGVTPLQAQRIANAIQVQTLEGKNPSSSQAALDEKLRDMSADEALALQAPKAPEVRSWSRAELEELADAKGIEGVRKVADEFDVKAKSIGALIEGILKRQPAPVVAPSAVPGLVTSAE